MDQATLMNQVKTIVNNAGSRCDQIMMDVNLMAANYHVPEVLRFQIHEQARKIQVNLEEANRLLFLMREGAPK